MTASDTWLSWPHWGHRCASWRRRWTMPTRSCDALRQCLHVPALRRPPTAALRSMATSTGGGTVDDVVQVPDQDGGSRQDYMGRLGLTPLIHPTATVRDCRIGPWTA